MDLFGGDKLSAFANTLGIDQGEAVSGLGAILPKLIDSVSSGGNLLSSVGSLSGAMNLARKFF